VVTLTADQWAGHFRTAENELRQRKLNAEKALSGSLMKDLFRIRPLNSSSTFPALRKIVTLKHSRGASRNSLTGRDVSSKLSTLRKKAPLKYEAGTKRNSLRRNAPSTASTLRKIVTLKYRRGTNCDSSIQEDTSSSTYPPLRKIVTLKYRPRVLRSPARHAQDLEPCLIGVIDPQRAREPCNGMDHHQPLSTDDPESNLPIKDPLELLYEAGTVQHSPCEECFKWDMQCIRVDRLENCFACWRRKKTCGRLIELGKWVQNDGRLVNLYSLAHLTCRLGRIVLTTPSSNIAQM
jgi:hypothetical protein